MIHDRTICVVVQIAVTHGSATTDTIEPETSRCRSALIGTFVHTVKFTHWFITSAPIPCMTKLVASHTVIIWACLRRRGGRGRGRSSAADSYRIRLATALAEFLFLDPLVQIHAPLCLLVLACAIHQGRLQAFGKVGPHDQGLRTTPFPWQSSSLLANIKNRHGIKRFDIAVAMAAIALTASKNASLL